MLIKIGQAKDVAEGEMHVYDVAGTKVNVANASGRRTSVQVTRVLSVKPGEPRIRARR